MSTKKQMKKYTVIHMVPVGYLAGQYIAQMKRVRTTDLKAYLKTHALDATHIFVGWPALEGAKQ